MTSAATSPMSSGERVDRATLLRVSEPAAVPLVRHVRAVGVTQTLRDIRAESPIPDVDVAALSQSMRELAADEQRRRELGRAARAAAEQFRPERMEEQYLTLAYDYLGRARG